jgi:hypothetical protein
MLRPARGGLALIVVLILGAQAGAQGERPWTRLFGPRPADKTPAKAPPTDQRRLTEIQVEIAWLADPLTFPYFLEARTTGSNLEVRGYVPNKAVRDHALNLARVYSALPVVDAVKEHTSLQVRTGQMSPQQLHSAVSLALREALPRQAPSLQVRCDPDGKVVVTGQVQSAEEKLTVSHSLRRLYGCTSVQNLTRQPTETATPPAVANQPVPAAPKLPTVGLTAAKAPTEPARPDALRPPLPPAGPTPTAAKHADVPAAPLEKQEPAGPAVADRLKKRIESACPGVKGIRIETVSANEFRIEVTAATEEQVGTFAERIFALPEVQSYKTDLQFKVAP